MLVTGRTLEYSKPSSVNPRTRPGSALARRVPSASTTIPHTCCHSNGSHQLISSSQALISGAPEHTTKSYAHAFVHSHLSILRSRRASHQVLQGSQPFLHPLQHPKQFTWGLGSTSWKCIVLSRATMDRSGLPRPRRPHSLRGASPSATRAASPPTPAQPRTACRASSL